MLRRILFNHLIGRRLRGYRRRRRRLTPTRIVRWFVGRVFATLITFAVIAALILYYFNEGAVGAVASGDAGVLTLVPVALANWFELGAALVVTTFLSFLPRRFRNTRDDRFYD